MKYCKNGEVAEGRGRGEVLGGSFFDLRGATLQRRRPGRDWHCVVFDLTPNRNQVNDGSDDIRKEDGINQRVGTFT